MNKLYATKQWGRSIIARMDATEEFERVYAANA